MIVFFGVSHFIFEAFPFNFAVELGVETFFILLVIGFAATEFKAIAPLYKAPKMPKEIIVLAILFPVFTAFSVSYGMNWIGENVLPDFEVTNYVSEYFYVDNVLFWSIFLVAILPPIFEELAFRGYLYEVVSKVASEKMTIVATAALFALAHFSFLSVIWIFPFGLFLGYLRKRYNTLWLPMLVHFIHNFIVVMIDYHDYNNGFF